MIMDIYFQQILDFSNINWNQLNMYQVDQNNNIWKLGFMVYDKDVINSFLCLEIALDARSWERSIKMVIILI